MEGLLIFITIMSAPIIFYTLIKWPEFSGMRKANNIVKEYKRGNMYPIVQFAKEVKDNNSVLRFTYVYEYLNEINCKKATREDLFNVIMLSQVLLNNTWIPDMFKTLEQKMAYLIAKNYNDTFRDLHRFFSYNNDRNPPYYPTAPEGVLQEIWNNDSLVLEFASKYFDERYDEIGKSNCIILWANDGDPIATQIMERAQKLWKEHNKEKEEEEAREQ